MAQSPPAIPSTARPAARGEIWAYGLRNPFTFAFSDHGRLYINDVGEQTWEELNVGASGANYGWPTCEGVCSRRALRRSHLHLPPLRRPGQVDHRRCFLQRRDVSRRLSRRLLLRRLRGQLHQALRPGNGPSDRVRDQRTEPGRPRRRSRRSALLPSVESKIVHRIAYGGPVRRPRRRRPRRTT